MSSQTKSTLLPLNANRPYRLAADVVVVPVADGSARVLDLKGKFFALSQVAAQMLCETIEHGPELAAQHIASRWGIELPRAKADLDAFQTQLLHQGLLIPTGQTDARPGLRVRLGSLIIAALIGFTCLSRRTLRRRAIGLLTLANLSCKWLGWVPTVQLWQRAFPKAPNLLEGEAAEAASQTVDAAVRQALADSTFSHACKERGLTSWAIARLHGLAPTLTLGVSLCPVHGHCWARLGDTFLGDETERCAQYQVVKTYQ